MHNRPVTSLQNSLNNCIQIILYYLFEVMFITAHAQMEPIDPIFLSDLYACNPPCDPDECCIHVWSPVLGKRRPYFNYQSDRKRTLETHCEPMKPEGAECLMQNDLEVCPCGRNLVCSAQVGHRGLYYGTCKP